MRKKYTAEKNNTEIRLQVGQGWWIHRATYDGSSGSMRWNESKLYVYLLARRLETIKKCFLHNEQTNKRAT